MKDLKQLRSDLEKLEMQKSEEQDMMNSARTKMAREAEDALSNEEFDMEEATVKSAAEVIKRLDTEIIETRMAIDTENKRRQEAVKSTGAFERLNSEESAKTLVDSKEFTDAYVKAIKGDTAEYKKFLSTTATDGTTAGAFGVVVPTVVLDAIEKKLNDYGGLLADAEITTIKGLMKIPYEVSRTGAEVHKEGAAAVSEEEITLGERMLDPEFIKKYITWTDKLETMSSVDLINYLTDEFLEEIFIKAESEMIYGAADQNCLEGITKIDPKTGLTTKFFIGEELTWATGFTAQGYLRPGQKQVKVYMNRRTFFQNILTIQDANGNPIYTIEQGQPFYNGLPVVYTDALPAYADAADGDAVMLMGVSGSYAVNAPNGLVPQFIRDDYTLMTSDKSRLLGKLMLAGTVKKLESWVVLCKGTGDVVSFR